MRTPTIFAGVVLALSILPLASRAQQAKGPPPGIEPLPVDLFTTEDYRKDAKLWTDRRYTRCNTPRQLTDMWVQHRSGEWGDCSVDSPVADIVSPYPYKTAEEHYKALKAAAQARGSLRHPTRATLPEWDGWYRRGGRDKQWPYGRNLQAATLIGLLTPEYRRRMTQMNYHEAVSNAPQWMAAFCYPEGFMRWWAEFSIGEIEVLTTPREVQLTAGVADNFVRKIMIDAEHIQQVPQWYGESIGFWDGDKLVVWTANVQAWTLSHSMFEYSDQLEAVEVYSPDGHGGLVAEATFYDPEAFTRPLHVVTPWARTGDIADGEHRYTYVECRVQSTIVNGPDGRPTQLTFNDPGFIDYFNRPWALNWEKHFEKPEPQQ